MVGLKTLEHRTVVSKAYIPGCEQGWELPHGALWPAFWENGQYHWGNCGEVREVLLLC